MKRFLKFAVVLSLFSFSISPAWSDDLSKLEGKWSVKKNNNEGQPITQIIEIKKDKFKFSVLGSDDKLRIYAEGNIKLAKLGPFNSIQFLNIKAGATESDVLPIDDDRASIYMLEDSSWTLASNLDKDRGDQKPSLDIYKKAPK